MQLGEFCPRYVIVVPNKGKLSVTTSFCGQRSENERFREEGERKQGEVTNLIQLNQNMTMNGKETLFESVLSEETFLENASVRLRRNLSMGGFRLQNLLALGSRAVVEVSTHAIFSLKCRV